MRPARYALLVALAACDSPARGPSTALPPEASSAEPTAQASIAPPVALEAPCDLLLRGARVIDPASSRDGLFDVAITDGKIARIAAPSSTIQAKRTLDLTGLVLTPGLVDLHTHVFRGDERDHYLANAPLAAAVDDAAPKGCTTTVVDAGSSGHRTFATFEEKVLSHSKTRVLALLNIVGWGMRGGRYEQDLADMDQDLAAKTIQAHPTELVGLKVAHYAGPGWEPIDRAVAAGKLAGVPVMVDFGGHVPELSLEELLLQHLRPGDIYTHAFAHVPGRTSLVDPQGALRSFVLPARKRGVLFDLGYGGKSFAFDQAKPALAQGFGMDSLSTDMHRTSLRGSMHDLPAVLTKMHALGVSLVEVLRESTVAPADAIHRSELGRLVEGGPADVAVFEVEPGAFPMNDVKGAQIQASERLACALTLRAGEEVWRRPEGLSRRRASADSSGRGAREKAPP